MTTAILTIVSNNYLHYARTLMESVARHHPEAQRYVVIVDKDPAPAAALAAEFEAIALDQLDLPHGPGFLFQYTILELNTAVKPWALAHLFGRGHDEVLYIDPDIYLYRPLDEVFGLLRGGASMVLTPHLVAPMTDDKHPGELDIRIAGTYNLGFLALRRHPATQRQLSWWQGKLARDCVVDFQAGIFVDQSWMDLVPGMYDDVAILRHPGYNIAYWNMAQRDVAKNGASYTVNGQALAFFHYSGISPLNPQPISKHQTRFTLDTVQPAVRELILDYCEKVKGKGQPHYSKLPYGFANFDDGTPIQAVTRTRYRTEPGVRARVGANPFAYLGPANPDHASAPVAAIDQEDIFTGGLGRVRLERVFYYFLGRPADPTAIATLAHRADTLPGYLRLALGAGRSPEARSRAGWLRRLALWPLLALSGSLPLPPAPVPPELPLPGPDAAAADQLPVQRSSELGINLVGYIAAELGVGEAARSLARACSAVDLPYSVLDVGYQSSNLQRDRQALDAAVKDNFAIDLVYVNADQTPVTLNYMREHGVDNQYKIGFWHWEQPALPEHHLASFQYLNEIWVPSRFVHDAVAAVSPRPVYIVPHALAVAATPGVKRSQFGLPENKLLALVMYDFHSYQHRKNPQAAIAAFRRAAAGRKDCALVVKTINGHYHPDAVKDLKAHLADLPGTVFLDQFLTRQEVWDLQSCCDMLISLHRAEGFGLGPAEMMWLGKPVVATGWSANMDFMTHENSMPVRYELKPLEIDLGAYKPGPVWAEADVEHAADCIRRLLDDAGLRERLGQRAARDIQAQLAPAVVGKLVKDRLQAIRHWYPGIFG